MSSPVLENNEVEAKSTTDIGAPAPPAGIRSSTLGSDIPSDFHLNCREWSNRTGLPYDAILSATKSGQLISYRPGGKTNGCVYVSVKDFYDWRDEQKTQRVIPGDIGRGDYVSKTDRDEFNIEDFMLSR